MIEQFRRRYLTPRYLYPNPLDAQQAQALMYLMAVGFVVLGIFVFVSWISAGFTLPFGTNNLITLMGLPLCGLIYGLAQRGYLRVASYFLVFYNIFAVTPPILEDFGQANVIMLALPMVVAGLLLRRRGAFLVLLVLILIALQGALLSNPSVAQRAGLFADLILVAMILIFVYFFLVVFNSNSQTLINQALQDLDDVREVAQLNTRMSLEANETQFIIEAINILRDRLKYDFAQVYLSDGSGEILNRVSSGLNVGQINVDTNITTSERTGIMRQVLRTGVAERISPTSDALVRAHLLPGIGSCALVPLRAEAEVLGVLDVQRESNEPFNSTEMATLDLMARELAVSIRQNRIFAEMRNDLKEQEALILGQRARLSEFIEGERRNTTLTWTSYLEQRGQSFIGFDMSMDDTSPMPAMNATSIMQSALTTGEIQTEIEGEYEIVSVPIILNEQVIGAMSFKIPALERRIGARQRELIENIVQRLALAIENRRLFEQSQSQAFRESTANQIGSVLLSNTDLETILQLAAEQFNEALGAVQARIHIQPELDQATEDTV